MKRVLLLIVVSVILAGLALWLIGSNGTKQAELGAGLVSTGLIGLLLVFVEQSFSRQSRNIRDVASLAAAGPPPIDTQATVTTAQGEHIRVTLSDTIGITDKGTAKVHEVRRFKVQYDGWQRDTTRIDAESARLRVFHADGSYFQFFTALVSGIGLRSALGSATNVTRSQFRRAFVDLAIEDIRHAIAEDEAPLDNPTMAIEVFPDAEEAARQARHVEDREYTQDEVIAEFDA